jgi:hypothetical protein
MAPAEKEVKRHLKALKQKGKLVRVTEDVPGYGKLKVFRLPEFKAWVEAESVKVISLHERRVHAPKKGASVRPQTAHTCAHNKDGNKDAEQGDPKGSPFDSVLDKTISVQGPP